MNVRRSVSGQGEIPDRR